MKSTVRIRIFRQDGPGAAGQVQEFDVPALPDRTIAQVLCEISLSPVTIHGERVAQVIWDECSHVGAGCGLCTMMISGQPRVACDARLSVLGWPVELRPLPNFPLLRDLMVDRSRLMRDLKRVAAGPRLDGIVSERAGPLQESPSRQGLRASLLACSSCGICLEVCPNAHRGRFVGAAVINRTRADLLHETDEGHAGLRLDALMQPGGIQDCGHVQNCVRSCPVEIPLHESIARLNRDLSRRMVVKIFG